MSIKELAYEVEIDITKIRRKIHRNPELALREFETSKIVAEKLKELGIEIIENIGTTGVVGLLRGKNGGKTVALRADMDALPIEEENNFEFKSVNKNIMHACGHDAHTAILLGVAIVLSKIKDSINGNVKFIFQPSEESSLGGAQEMINEGVLKNPMVDSILGLHVDPALLSGTIGYRSGEFYASGGGFQIDIIGKSGHGALPHKATDAILVAAELILSLQTIKSSRIDPLDPFVLTIGTINGGSQANIIANKVTLTGTLRLFNEEINKNIGGIMENIIKSITHAYGATYNFKLQLGGTPLTNDSRMIEIVKNSARKIVGEENVRLVPRTLLGEDFACYTRIVPSAFVSLGVGFSDKKNFSLHSSKFDIDEASLPIGTALLAQSAIDFLNNTNN